MTLLLGDTSFLRFDVSVAHVTVGGSVLVRSSIGPRGACAWARLPPFPPFHLVLPLHPFSL